MMETVSNNITAGAKLAALSFASMMAGQVPAVQELTEVGQLASIIISIVSGFVALFKLFKKKKSTS